MKIILIHNSSEARSGGAAGGGSGNDERICKLHPQWPGEQTLSIQWGVGRVEFPYHHFPPILAALKLLLSILWARMAYEISFLSFGLVSLRFPSPGSLRSPRMIETFMNDPHFGWASEEISIPIIINIFYSEKSLISSAAQPGFAGVRDRRRMTRAPPFLPSFVGYSRWA